MNSKKFFYPESAFGGFTNVDGAVHFYTRVQCLVEPSYVVLDLGSGPKRGDAVKIRQELRTLRGKCKRVIGIDVEPFEDNPLIDEFRLIESDRWPIEDQSIDLVVSDYVFEHIEKPEQLFSELARVVKPGGYVCLRTPNIYGYVSLISRLIPNALHQRIIGRVQSKQRTAFPTFYRCNSRRKLRSLFSRFGFDHQVWTRDSEPAYFAFSSVAYFLGVLHQRFSPPFLRLVIYAFARKRGGQDDGRKSNQEE